MVLHPIVLISLAIMFGPTFYKLATMGWPMADYSHAAFIAPISFWLVYKKRALLEVAGSAAFWKWVPLLFSVLLFVYARRSDFMFLEAFSFFAVVSSVCFLRLVPSSFVLIGFPLVYLLFLVPPPMMVIDMMTYPLKEISSVGSYQLLRVTGFDVTLRGAILLVGDYEFFIADACSGFRSMVTLLSLGALWAYLQNGSVVRKAVLFASVVPMGIAANIFRIFLTGCISHFVGIKYAEGFFHEFSGAVLFLVTIAGLLVMTRVLLGKQVYVASAVASEGFFHWIGTIKLMPSWRDSVIALLITAAASFVFLNPVEKLYADRKLDVAAMVPEQFRGWISRTEDTSDYTDKWQSINTLLMRSYIKKPISLLANPEIYRLGAIVEYTSDLRKNFSFHFPEGCHRASGNEIIFLEPLTVEMSDGRVMKAKRLFIRGKRGSVEPVDKIVTYWLTIGKKQYYRTFFIKLDQALAGLLSQAKQGFLLRVDVILGSEYSDDEVEKAALWTKRFVSDLYGVVSEETRDLLFGEV